VYLGVLGEESILGGAVPHQENSGYVRFGHVPS
jgi:hypothetical protein